MKYELKKWAMDCVSGTKSVVKGLGYAKTAALGGVYLAKIREADRERLRGTHGATVINNVNVHNTVGNFQGMQNRNNTGKDI